MKLDQALLYAHTIRRLLPVQIAAQVSQKLRGFRPAPAAEQAPPFPGWRRRPQRPLLAARGADFNPVSSLRRARWNFLNEERVGTSANRWQVGETSKLWLYNLQYHEWIWSLEPEEAAAMVEDWMQTHPADVSTDAWEPYVISLRLQNWVGYFSERGFAALENQGFRERWWRCIYQQAECLRRNLEVHLQANHLLENAIALTMVAAAFDGAWAKGLWESAWPLLEEELDRQFLSDGMHYERSPLYQARLLYALAQTEAFLDEGRQSILRARLQAGARALRCLSHGDGEIALFNDSACGIAHTPRVLLGHLEREELIDNRRLDGGWALPAAGYFGFCHQGLNLIADLGSFAPRHQPGHAHADFGSFELSVGSTRIVTDTGVHHYLPNASRTYDRSVAAHNTVEVEGLRQIELWSAFRAAREGKVTHQIEQADERGLRVRGELVSYAERGQTYRHTRAWDCDASGRIAWEDTLQASCTLSATTRLHLAPQVGFRDAVDGAIWQHPAEIEFHSALPRNVVWEVGASVYHPAFQQEEARSMLVGRAQVGPHASHWRHELQLRAAPTGGWHANCQPKALASSPSLV
ncbi:MAG: alginate lyase family protein [Verrucomicrobiota bacterium JB022]|nr:alginate lyase family protein [Verrucomicrobiota bacterium JB022]